MRYKLLGQTGLELSALSLGTMTFGGWHVIGDLGEKQAAELVARALDAGVNFFDTADAYGGGEAERLLGRALGKRRQDVIVASKVRLTLGEGPNRGGLTRWHIMRAVEASLQRLGTDVIDLYQLHIVDAWTPLEETVRALDDLVRAGKVRYTGVCNYPAWQIMKGLALADAHGWSRFVSLQAYYSLVGRGLERELLPLVRDQKLGLLIWSPLAGGFLSGKFHRDDDGPEGARRAQFDFPPVQRPQAWDVLDALRDVAAEQELSVARVALAWLLHQEGVTSVIVGAKRAEQLEDNLKAIEVELTADQLEHLDQVSALPAEYPGWMLDWPWDSRMKRGPDS
jgi:aryl-alcohol dehydrogenase-like predicted oxidoreductase